MLVSLAQAAAAGEDSAGSLRVLSAVIGLVVAISGFGLLFLNHRRTPAGEAQDRNWMYYSGGIGVAAGLMMAAYGLLGLGS
ncbi:MAG TPA: hypothetical protein VJM46_03250 [Candidatus Saccharimonadales bacterium]|nr:hypothetical protein [Candidatus Saccharimonadales bacterium]